MILAEVNEFDVFVQPNELNAQCNFLYTTVFIIDRRFGYDL